MPEGRQVPGQYSGTVTTHVELQYLLYLPEGYAASKHAWPLVLFLHGMGERGKDLNLVKRHGPPALADKGTQYPFILLSPQCPDDEFWSVPALKALLDDVERRHRVDPARVYVTGLSMGGNGTWRLAAAYPDHFAAIVPICGWGDTAAAAAMKDIPAWVFHGQKDPVVPVDRSNAIVRALRAVGADVRLTVYPEAGHDAWSETYRNQELFQWLMAQKRPSARGSAGK
ncbi:MAG: alpha/beta fold hydrolase [Bacteroidota bacterium]